MSDRDFDITLPEAAHEILFGPSFHRSAFEENLLPAYIPRCRWFAGKARNPRRFTIQDLIPISSEPRAARLMLVRVEYADLSSETYLLPLQFVSGPRAVELAGQHPAAIVHSFSAGVLCDAIHDPEFRAALFTLMQQRATIPGAKGKLTGYPGPALGEVDHKSVSRPLAVEQSNSSIIYGEKIFLKLYRRLEAGINSDAEILRFLSRQGFAHTPPFAGAIEYQGEDGQNCVMSLATGLVPNNGDAWSFALRELARWFAAHLAGNVTEAAKIEQNCLARAAQLGTRTGELHLALASDPSDPDFSPQPLGARDGQELAEGILASAELVYNLIASKLDALPDPARNLAQRFLSAAPALRSRALSIPANVAKVRTHGDYHLGQVIETGGDFVIIDFEGEPLRSLATRRERRSPFRDVAGMLRSFDYAAHAALDAQPMHQETLAGPAANWSVKAQQAFLDAWMAVTRNAVFRAANPQEEQALLEAFLLEKALYEVVYEINNRPTWLPIPLRGVLRLIDGA
ncbi:MAG TPA: putative maltokinase [Chthoniobacter sp.]|jgi:trehalose synthase-fused probable maltokinase